MIWHDARLFFDGAVFAIACMSMAQTLPRLTGTLRALWRERNAINASKRDKNH
jgi:hypothetical protein